MKKILLLLLLSFLSLFVSCNDESSENDGNNQKNENSQDTNSQGLSEGKTELNADSVIVIIQAGGGNVRYSFVNDEGDTYKSGTLHNFESITITHFKKGLYNIHFTYGGHVKRTNTISITKNSVLTIDDATSVKITDASDNIEQPQTNQNSTVKLILKAGGGKISYSFIDSEGEIYKQGNLNNFEAITINHFKTGKYNIHFRYGGHVETYNIISITQDCTIKIDNSTSVTIN